MNDLERATAAVALTAEGPERKVQLSQEQADLLQRTVCKDHTADEIQLFMQYCAAKGLDPFGREVYSVKRAGKVTFQMGIDGLRGKAEETNEYNGQETQWCDENGKWVDVWVSGMPPFAAKVSVFRKGIDKAFVGIALWAEYKPADNDFIWKKMPSNQLAKCAEAIALRKAFPRKLGGLYASEEMEQASGATSSKPKIAMPKAKAVSQEVEAEVESAPEDSFREPPAEYTEPPVGMSSEHAAAMDAQAPSTPRTKEDIEKALRPPQSKFFAALHATVRKAGISETKMKAAMKLLFNKESSKDLTDEECSKLIKQVEKGGIR